MTIQTYIQCYSPYNWYVRGGKNNAWKKSEYNLLLKGVILNNDNNTWLNLNIKTEHSTFRITLEKIWR